MIGRLIIILTFISAVPLMAQDTLTIHQIRQNPHNGQVVFTGGIVTAGDDVNIGFFGRNLYLADPGGGPYSGIKVISLGNYRLLAIGDSVTMTATVRFIGNSVTLSLNSSSLHYISHTSPIDPTPVSASILDTSGVPDSLYRQYEGAYVRISNVTLDRASSLWPMTWYCHNEDAVFQAMVGSSLIPNPFNPPNGTAFAYVDGIVERIEGFNRISLLPRLLADFGIPSGAPMISQIDQKPHLPLNTSAVRARAIIIDDMNVSQASLFYRIDNGSWTQVAAADSGNALYVANIPSNPESTHVDYYYRAADIDNNIKFEPANAPDSFYSYTVGWRERCNYVPGDINGSGFFSGLDIVYGILFMIGQNYPPPYPCDCSERYPFFPAGDVNNSCTFTGLDITYMVSYLKGGPPLQPCQNCLPVR